MSSSFPRLKYTGATPGADANTYPLLNTVTAGFPANFFAMAGVHRVLVDIKTINADGGYTLNWYMSTDRGTNWTQVGTEVVAAATNPTSETNDYIVEEYADWKLELVNNGTAKTVFGVNIALTDQRSTLA